MSQNVEKVFADGFSFKRREGAPEFVIGRQSIKVDEAVAFLKANVKNGWVNIDIKQSKKGTFYCELDTWEAKPQTSAPTTTELAATAPAPAPTTADDVPF
tara:strand:- start:12863 stop:13162 length:300 start_codon:yes stop_codon:yes gene_type:complete